MRWTLLALTLGVLWLTPEWNVFLGQTVPPGRLPVPPAAPAISKPPPRDPSFPTIPKPRWFKGNLHTHSLRSDGNDFPEMIVDWYVRHGYNFLALSDHNVLNTDDAWLSVAVAERRSFRQGYRRYRDRFGDNWVETRIERDDTQVRLKPLREYRSLFEKTGEFLLIPGEEITDQFGGKPVHMNVTNLLEVIDPQHGKSVVDTMNRTFEAAAAQSLRLGRPMFTHVNHPNFGYAITAEELAMVTKERFFEVYNGHPDVHQLGDQFHVSIERMWDIINTLRIGEMKIPPVNGLATDDSHNYFGRAGSSPGRGWIMVRSRYLTSESVLKALESAEFYASSGVTLKDVRFDPVSKSLELEIVPQANANYTIQFIGTRKGYDPKRTPVKGVDGSELAVTQRYSIDVGRVLAESVGTSARYQLKGDELYVRAVVTSTLAPENPSYHHQRAQAWTQPVGWQKWMPVAVGAETTSFSEPRQ